jgi:hypothetical protein
MNQIGRQTLVIPFVGLAGDDAPFIAEYDGINFTGFTIVAIFSSAYLSTPLELRSDNGRITVTAIPPSTVPNTIAFNLTEDETLSLRGGGKFKIRVTSPGGDTWTHVRGETFFEDVG